MRLSIFPIFFCLCITASAQYSTGPDRIVLKKDTSYVYQDGLKLYVKYRKQIGDKLLNSVKDGGRFKYDKQDSVVYVTTKFIYLIDGEAYKKKKRKSKLKTLDPDNIVSFDFYLKNEAYEKFKIRAKYGLIKIEFQ